jgi:hypothetical protein
VKRLVDPLLDVHWPFPFHSWDDNRLGWACIASPRPGATRYRGAFFGSVFSIAFFGLTQEGIRKAVLPFLPESECTRLVQPEPELITTLLNAGADAKAKSSVGKTAFNFAQYNLKLIGTDAYRKLQEGS